MNCQERSLGRARRSIGDRLSRQLWSLESESLCAEARRRTGLRDFGDPPIEPALSILVNSLEIEAGLHPLGQFLMRAHLRELLETRLRLAQLWRTQSESLDAAPIRRPVFITGMPRSGSTFLHELLAQDGRNRVPRVWEVMFPIPGHNSTKSEVEPRVGKAEYCLWWFRRLAPGANSVYPLRAWTPHECVAIHSYTLLSEEFAMVCRVPAYEAFLRGANFSLAYAWQKRFLQYLQLSDPTRQWILKSPDHVHTLGHLLTVFPDAVVIQTHRNPLEVLKSSMHLTEVLERTFARANDRSEIRQREIRNLAEHVESITSFREANPELDGRFIDVRYHELILDPLTLVGQIYQRLDMPLTEMAAERMQRLASMRSRYKGRRSDGKPADFELDGSLDRHRLEAYCSRFGFPLGTAS
jgi:hypothetical protein